MKLHHRAHQRLRRERSQVPVNQGGRLRVLLAYPNHYSVAMSNLGVHTVYRLLNSHGDVRCERAFLPDDDELLAHRRTGTPLFSLESQTPAADFDVIALSASFENDYPNILTLLDLAGLPRRAADRDDTWPLVIMGGATVSINPEPVAPFLDVCCVGEGEELIDPLVGGLLEADARGALLERLAATPGFYVPSLYEPVLGRGGPAQSASPDSKRGRAARPDDGSSTAFAGLTPTGGAAPIVTKVRAKLEGPARVARTAIQTPDTEFGDRLMVEVARGCTKGCRYCWVGYSILPFRVHAVEDVLAAASEWREHTDRVGLVATALLDHPEIEAIAAGLRSEGFKIFSPSLIISTLREPLLRAVVESGQDTITIAPEAGSDRMRELVMKRITNDEILEKVRMIFRAGAVNLKNYVIIGLPGENEEDLAAIVDLARAMREIMVDECRQRGRLGTITMSVNCLIPKPGTPLQWAPQLPAAEYKRRLRWLRKRLARVPNVTLDAMPARAAEIQAVMSRGDRRAADLLELWQDGGDWRSALRQWRERTGCRLEDYLEPAVPGAPLPWDHLRIGPSTAALVNQFERAQQVAAST